MIAPIAYTPLKICRECEKQHADFYWFDERGKRVEIPLCRECHEDEVRRATRRYVSDPSNRVE